MKPLHVCTFLLPAFIDYCEIVGVADRRAVRKLVQQLLSKVEVESELDPRLRYDDYVLQYVQLALAFVIFPFMLPL